MKKASIVILVIILILGGGILIFNFMGPNLKEYEKLKTPRISEMQDQKMIEVRLTGNPDMTAGKGISDLFRTFFMLKKDHKNMKLSAPRARWPQTSFTKDSKDWVGTFGIPVPDDVNEKDLASQTNSQNPVKVAIWKYGKVAEILHIGAYDKETPTINALHQFIKEKGYVIIGDHEEEYLKGPGPFSFNPNNYYTVIRYRVQKK